MIVFEPCYDSYVPSVELNGGTAVVISLRYPDYAVPWDEVRARDHAAHEDDHVQHAAQSGGGRFARPISRELISIVDGTNILIVSDEVYEHIIFDGAQHESMARHEPLRQRSFIVGSFGKTFQVTGWKMGYVAAPAALMAEFRKAHQFVTFSSFTPVQYALAEFLNERRGWPELSAFYERKRDLFLSLLAGSRWKPLKSRGTLLPAPRLLGDHRESDMDFALRLTREHGVASIPTSAFLYNQPPPPVLRFCFAKKDETLRAAARLRAL